jgi:hypothetical protein
MPSSLLLGLLKWAVPCEHHRRHLCSDVDMVILSSLECRPRHNSVFIDHRFPRPRLLVPSSDENFLTVLSLFEC